jgi:hypothetical protein
MFRQRTQRTLNPILREDGTVYFDIDQASRPISEKLCEWTLALLWCLAAAVLVAAIFPM